MILVADANVLFSLIKKDSVTSKLAEKHNIKLISPEFVIKELCNHKEEILSKTGVSIKQAVESLEKKVDFIDLKEYQDFIKKASKIIEDPKDIDFMALALKFNLSIWSNDKHFKKQSEVKVFSTKEIILLFNGV